MDRRARLCANGFSFEYSATFGQAIKLLLDASNENCWRPTRKASSSTIPTSSSTTMGMAKISDLKLGAGTGGRNTPPLPDRGDAGFSTNSAADLQMAARRWFHTCLSHRSWSSSAVSVTGQRQKPGRIRLGSDTEVPWRVHGIAKRRSAASSDSFVGKLVA